MQRDESLAFLPYPEAPVLHTTDGPLAGLRFAVKDLFDVAGYPTGGGNPFALAASGIKARTAPAVQRLLDAGCRFTGKVVTDEFAYSINGINAHFGAPVNGAAPDRVTGGSSSGSASAVSCGLADTALGTDTGGSVRAPASHCGLFGIRPTHGRIPLDDCMPLAPSFDTCGFFARDAATFERVAAVMLGDDPAPLPPGNGLGPGPRGAAARPLQPVDVWAMLAAPVADALAPALAAAGRVLGEPTPIRVAQGDLETMFDQYRLIQGIEAWQSHGALIRRHAVPLGPGVAERFAWASTVTEAQVAPARAFQQRLREHMARLLGRDGVLVMPTMPDVAPRRDSDEAALDRYRQAAFRMLCIAGLAGLPQVSLPLARRDGAPLGLSLVGPAGSDLSLVRLAAAVAQAAGRSEAAAP